jgi:large subunit ribosomal protein L9
MQLVLIDDVLHLGRRGDVVSVAAGYGRNYLIPQGLAVAATSANLKMVEQQRAALARKETRVKEDAEILARDLDKLHLVLSRKAGETGALFGSVTAKDLADLLAEKGFNVDRQKIDLEHPLKTIGNFPVEAHPHPDVKLEFLVSVVLEEEEPFTRILNQETDESAEIVSGVENLLSQASKELEAQKEALPDEALEGRQESPSEGERAVDEVGEAAQKEESHS